MAADGVTALANLLWGTATGGSAGSGESTLTLGVDRVDGRVPLDTTRVWGTQINQTKNLAMLMSQFYAGGTRLKAIPQTANPFGVSEAGLYIDANGNLCLSYLGVVSQLIVGHVERGFSAITTGVGNTHEYLDVTLGTAFAAATGANGYSVEVQISLTTATDPGIVCEGIVNKTTTGFRINFSGDFNGEVRWRAF